MFDKDIGILDLTTVDCNSDIDINFDDLVDDSSGNMFVDTVLIYISGFIMRTLIKKESCGFCFTFLKECKDRVSCSLINNKQKGGLMYPIVDIVSVVSLSNRKCEAPYFSSNSGGALYLAI